ncbi:MAG TPA: TetR family transcriptional regulator [Methylophilaceae bacterium]|nr:TetR family transcriptional regulator [Methylophilaceae bacterium]
MLTKSTSEQDKQELRARIMEVARDLFVQKGIDAVTMREIAKRIGYSATSIYLYFADKQALLREICESDFAAMASHIKVILEIADAEKRLIAISDSYAKFALMYPNHYQLMYMTPHARYGISVDDEYKNNLEKDAYFQLRTVVNAVFLEGKFRKEWNDVDLIAQTLWAGIHGVCALQITMPKEDWINWRPVEHRLQMMQTLLKLGLTER